MAAKKSKKSSRSFTHLFSGIAILGVLILAFSLSFQHLNTLDSNNAVLGDSDSDNSDLRKQEDSQHEQEKAREMHEAIRQGSAQQELQSEGRKMQFESESGGAKTKFKIEDNGKIKFKIQRHTNEQTESEQEDNLEIEDESDVVDVATRESGFEFAHKNQKAISHYPLSVNPETNELIVTTPHGTKIVTILPDAAVQKAFQNRLLTIVKPPEGSGSATQPTGTESATTQAVELTVKNNKLAYKVHGVKEYKLLGLLPVYAENTAYVSAEDGNIITQEHSIFATILGLLSSK